MVDAEATFHVIKVNFDYLFQPVNHFIEMADSTKTKGVALKQGDTGICLEDRDRNHETVSLKVALYIPSYPQNILSVKSAMANWATITFKKNKNVLVYWNGSKF